MSGNGAACRAHRVIRASRPAFTQREMLSIKNGKFGADRTRFFSSTIPAFQYGDAQHLKCPTFLKLPKEDLS